MIRRYYAYIKQLIPHNRFLEFDFSLKSEDAAGKITELYVIALFFLYPLFLMSGSVVHIQVKILLFYILTTATILAYLVLVSRGGAVVRRPVNPGDYALLLLGFWNLIVIPIKLFQGNMSYGQNLFRVSLVLGFYLLSCGFRFYEYYLDLLLFSGAAVFMGLLGHYFGSMDFVKPIQLLAENSQAEASYLILISSLAVFRYCLNKNKDNDYFYLILSGCGFLLLFINGHAVGMLLQALVFLVVPLIFRPTAALFKRNMTLCFLYFFILSNMGLLVNYSGLIKKELHFEIMNSIYLDLLLAAIGIIVLSYWEKLPESILQEDSKLPGMQKIFRRLLAGAGILFLFILLAGNKLETMNQHLGISVIQSMIQRIQDCYLAEHGSFFDVLQEFGIAGFLLAVFLAAAVGKMIKKHKSAIRTGLILKGVSMLFLVQLLFFSIHTVSAPIYVVLLGFWLYGRES